MITLKDTTITSLLERFGREQLEATLQQLNIAGTVEALTESEGRYLLSFSSLERARARLTEAQSAILQRGDLEAQPESEVRQSVGTQGDPQSPSSTTIKLQRELRRILGGKGYTALKRNGTINIINSSQIPEITGVERRGVKDKGFIIGKKVYLVEDNIGDGEVLDILIHELSSHDYVDELLGSNMDDFISIMESESKQDSKEGKAIRAARAMIPKKTKPEHYNSEWLAYYLQHTAKRSDSLYRRIISTMKGALIRIGINPKTA